MLTDLTYLNTYKVEKNLAGNRISKSFKKRNANSELKQTTMSLFEKIKNIFNSSDFTISDFVAEKESKEYDACNLKLADFKIHFRKAKITPKKAGQFVTFYKRIPSGVIAPFEETDNFDFLVVGVQDDLHDGYFVFSKAELIKRQIVSTNFKEGKRAFRIYPPWSEPKSKQAIASQKWQTECFVADINLKHFQLKKFIKKQISMKS